MKTIIYSLIVIIVFGTIAAGYTNAVKKENYLFIQATDKNVSFDLLSQSASIISGRLKDFGSDKYELKLYPEKNQIQVKLSDSWDLKTAGLLIMQSGSLSFYETYNSDSINELIGDDQLFSLLNRNNGNSSIAEIGCTVLENVGSINNYLANLSLCQQCKFAWSYFSHDSAICLYALRYGDEGRELLTGTEIESMAYKQDKPANTSYIEIGFKESATELWSDATERNINNAIAIVLDNAVISAPIVQSVIDSGTCQITGDFTPGEARYIAAIGNNGELPIHFKIVK